MTSLDEKLRSVLPPRYANYDEVRPVSMGTAGLKFDAAGRVAWDEIWGSFCDLAMAGGPPHKGRLLEAATETEIAAAPEAYRKVVEEICRGIRMVSDLAVEPSDQAGWVTVYCTDRVMAGWMTRAIVMENVSARFREDMVDLPAGPGYRLEKEIKNVITSLAKTLHYFDGHLEAGQEKRIATVFGEAEAAEGPLLQPGSEAPGGAWLESVAGRVLVATGMGLGGEAYRGWVGFEAGSVERAIWLMRALVVGSVLARREGTVLFVPCDLVGDAAGDRVVGAVVGAWAEYHIRHQH